MMPLHVHDDDTGWQDFCDVLDAVLCWRGGIVVMLSAYLDASTRTSGIFCVAGLAFGRDSAKKADRAWRTLFGGRICHMADLHAQRGDFAGCPPTETTRLHRAAIAIVNRYASYKMAVSCNLHEAERILPTSADPGLEVFLNSARKAYPACCHIAMTSLSIMIDKASRPKPERVAYFFESGDNYASYAGTYMAGIPEVIRDKQHYHSHTFVSKGQARLLEAADILAWEWAKHIDRIQQDNKPARPSLEALAGSPIGRADHLISPTFLARHADAEKLQRWATNLSERVLSYENGEQE